MTATPYSGTYDASAHTITASAAQAGSTLYYSTDNATWSETAPTWTDVTDAQTVYVKATNPNYEDALGQATVTITPKAVTVTANDKSKVYGDDDPALDATVSGTLGTDTVAYTVSRAAGEDVGTYTITPAGDAAQGNYAVTYATGTLTITAPSITDETRFAVSQPADVVYNGLEQRQGVTVHDSTTGKDLAEGTDYTLSYSDDVTNVGTVTVTVTGIGNYTGTVDRMYKITPATLTITAHDNGKIYGQTDQDPISDYAVTGLANDEVPNYTGKLAREIGENPGTYVINQGTLEATDSTFVSAGGTSFNASNYTVKYISATYTIVPLKDAYSVTKTLENSGTGKDGSFKAGETAEYKIVVTNKSAYDATNVTVNDVLAGASGSVVVNAGEGYTVNGTTATIAKLDKGSSVTITASYTVTQDDVDNAADITNTAIIPGDGNSPDVPSDPVPTPVVPKSPDFSITKTLTNSGTADNGAFNAGETATFDITVTNTGNCTLDSLKVVDNLSGATILNGDGYTVVDNTAVIDTLAIGSTVTVKASYTIAESDLGTSLANTATGTVPADKKGGNEVTKTTDGVTIPVAPQPAAPAPKKQIPNTGDNLALQQAIYYLAGGGLGCISVGLRRRRHEKRGAKK